MKTFDIFDANAQIGRHLRLQPEQPHSVAHLLDDMDHCGVAEAMVIDSLARENHPGDGNARILEGIRGRPRLHAAWSAMPHAPADEQVRGEALLDAMRAQRVGLLHLYPEQFKFNLADWCVDEFLEPLAAARVPVLINYNEVGPAGGWGWDQTDWQAVVALCRRWPDLPVIVGEYRMRRANRLIYRALDACPNLRLELGGLWLHRAIEFITEHWGNRRLIYGSQWPRLGMGPTLATLMCADVADDDKRRIAGDNLRELVRWADPVRAEVDLPPPADEFAAFGRTGERPESMTFMDNHGHIGGRALHYHLPGCTLDGIVADMDRLGVRKACIFGFTGIFSDEQPGNDRTAEAVRRYPDRFIGFTMLNPHRGERGMLAELERGEKMGLRGIKLIPHYQGYPQEGPLIDVACRWAHERGGIILNHDWGSPRQMERLVSTYAGACFFTGHCTTAYEDIMRRYDNLYVCSCPLLTPGACEAVVACIGAERLLFGSDLQDLPIAWGLGPILFARLAPEAKRRILGGNLASVLDRYPWVASR